MSRILCSMDPRLVADHPQLEPEVTRAILASWASDRAAVPDRPSLQKPPGFNEPISLANVLSALRRLDGGPARSNA